MSEIVTLAESLIPLIRELRHRTENDRCIADPIVQVFVRVTYVECSSTLACPHDTRRESG
jgi:hypothetical protein